MSWVKGVWYGVPQVARTRSRMNEWASYIPLVVYAGEWIIRISLAPVVIRRHAPMTALAWLAVIFFLPWVSLFVYVILGSGPLARRRMQAYQRAIDRFETPDRLAPLLPHVTPIEEINEHRRDMVRLAERLGRLPIVSGNAVTLMSDSSEVIGAIVAEIDAAEHTAHLLYYIFREDRSGREVAGALERAAARGVACRLLVDDVGSRSMLRSLAPRLRRAGVEVHPMLPVRFLRSRLARVDMRNHRKLAVIDGRVAVTGSQNIADSDYGYKGYGAWRDLSVRLEGPIVHALQLVFLESWHIEAGEPEQSVCPIPQPSGNVHVQAVPSGPGHRAEAFRGLIVDAVHEADERVVLTTPYLVPDEPLVLALRLAALGGVRVDVVVPERSNHWLVNAAARAYFDDLVPAGVNIHLHRNGMLHAKSITIDDDCALIGSGNFDMRSFSLNFELNLLMFESGIVRHLRQIQDAYIAESVRLDAEAWRKRPPLRQFADHTAKLMSPLL